MVIDPQASHRVMDRGKNAHGRFVSVLSGDFFIHVEKIAVLFTDLRLSQAANGIGEVEIDALATWADATPLVTDFLRIPGGNVAGDEIAEAWVAPLEVIVALVFGDGTRGTRVTLFLGDPYAAVIPQRFGHQSELGLMLAAYGDARGMNLGEARVSEERAATVGAPDGRGVRA